MHHVLIAVKLVQLYYGPLRINQPQKCAANRNPTVLDIALPWMCADAAQQHEALHDCRHGCRHCCPHKTVAGDLMHCTNITAASVLLTESMLLLLACYPASLHLY
jgi:hypothetical protein